MKWFYAIFLMSTSPGGVSAKDLERKLGVTYVTAWKMAKKLRGAMPSEQELRRMRSLEALIAQYAFAFMEQEGEAGEGKRRSSLPASLPLSGKLPPLSAAPGSGR